LSSRPPHDGRVISAIFDGSIPATITAIVSAIAGLAIVSIETPSRTAIIGIVVAVVIVLSIVVAVVTNAIATTRPITRAVIWVCRICRVCRVCLSTDTR
jgi:hypothetical protein